MRNPNLEAALGYCHRGWSVIPLRWTGGIDERKRPLLETWEPFQHVAPTPQQVEGWWHEWPQANVGLVMGKVSGLVAIDLDGPGALALIQQAGIFLPKTASVKTGKGWHAIYRHPGLTTPNKSRLLKDESGSAVDVRGDGGYIVAPPSVHGSGHVYAWLVEPDDALEPLPPSLLRLLSGEKPFTSRNEPGWFASALAGVPLGQRDETCAKLAGYLIGKDIDAETAEAILIHAFARHCEPPFPASEVRKTVRSIGRRDRANDNGHPVVAIPLSEALHGLLETLKSGPPHSIGTPFPGLNRMLAGGFCAGELIYMGARPGVGKTALALELARHAAKEGETVLVVSREMVNLALARRMLSQESKVRAQSLKSGHIGEGEWVFLREALPRLEQLPLWLTDKAISLEQIRTMVEHFTPALQFLIVDYLQLVQAPLEVKDRRLQVEAVSQALKTLAVQQQIPVLCLSSVSRSLSGKDDEPTLASLRESGELEHDADIVLLLHRKRGQAETKCIVAKNRDGWDGTVPLLFRSECVAFEESSVRTED